MSPVVSQPSNIVIVHGSGPPAGGNSRNAWIPWAKAQFEAQALMVCTPDMPDSIEGKASIWLEHFDHKLAIGKGDVLIGWSTGAVAALRYAERHELDGLVLVAPY